MGILCLAHEGLSEAPRPSWAVRCGVLWGQGAAAWPCSHKSTRPGCSWALRACVTLAANQQELWAQGIPWHWTEAETIEWQLLLALLLRGITQLKAAASISYFHLVLFFIPETLPVSEHIKWYTKQSTYINLSLRSSSCVLLTETFQFHKYLMKWLPIAGRHSWANCCCGQTTKLLSICLQCHITMNTADKQVIKVLEASPQNLGLFS